MSICHLCGGAGACPFCDGKGAIRPYLIDSDDFIPRLGKAHGHPLAPDWGTDPKAWGIFRVRAEPEVYIAHLGLDEHERLLLYLALGIATTEVQMQARRYLLRDTGTRTSSGGDNGQDIESRDHPGATPGPGGDFGDPAPSGSPRRRHRP